MDKIEVVRTHNLPCRGFLQLPGGKMQLLPPTFSTYGTAIGLLVVSSWQW